MINEIMMAIHCRKCLLLWYYGGYLIVEPHCYGEGKEGQSLLRVYQISGHDEYQFPEGWRLIHLEKAKDIKITTENFLGPRGGYTAEQDPHIVKIFKSLTQLK